MARRRTAYGKELCGALKKPSLKLLASDQAVKPLRFPTGTSQVLTECLPPNFGLERPRSEIARQPQGASLVFRPWRVPLHLLNAYPLVRALSGMGCQC